MAGAVGSMMMEKEEQGVKQNQTEPLKQSVHFSLKIRSFGSLTYDLHTSTRYFNNNAGHNQLRTLS